MSAQSLTPAVPPRSEPTGRVVLVTGASRGIGLAAAREFAARGDRVVLAARSEPALLEAVDSIRAAGGQAWCFAADLGEPDQCDEVVRFVEREVGPVDIAVLGAGVGHWTPTVDMADDAWRETQRINVDGVFLLTRSALKSMIARGSGHLVFISSVMAERGVPNMSAYTASKAAVASFAKSVAVEVKPLGVRVTVLYPGTTATTMREHQHGRPLTPDITEAELQLSAEDVAESVVWSTTRSERAQVSGLYLEPRGAAARGGR
ncbi:MAG TPA: SDR family oxidoreductase [Actinomycetales bacterium]|nr:SDR family oxidoreductase [Actinomycetales bacterium]